MSGKKTTIILLGTLFVLSLIAHFAFSLRPAEVVFDEFHYGKFVNGYFKGEYFFSGHPPLGIQLTALGAKIFNYQPHLDFDQIGQKFSDFSFASLRFAPNFAGALIPLAVYLFLRSLKISKKPSFFTALFLIFENALLVQSRFILIDSFLILFGFLGLAFFFFSRAKQHSLRYLLLAGLFLGMSFSVKWTGLSFLAVACTIAAFDLVKNRRRSVRFFIGLIFLPVLVYFAVFAIHFRLLPKAGPGDIFMTKEFLSGQENVFEKFVELNKASYYSNVRGLTAGHPYSSKFFTWPAMQRPIFYWVNDDARIYSLGNPFLWWGSSLVVLAAIFFTFRSLFKDRILVFLLSGYFLNLLPYFGIQRATFLYHYLPSLIFAVAIMAYLISKLGRHSTKILIVFLAVSIGFFVYFAPLTYGLNLSPKAYENRVWLESWK